MGASASKLLCIAVLASAPACLGDDPDHSDLGTLVLGTPKFHSGLASAVDVNRAEVLPPKTRSTQPDVQVPQNADYVEEVSGGSNLVIDPIHVMTAADIQPIVLLLHHFDANGVEHVSILDAKAIAGE